jgi:hypothetical protein
MMAWERVAVKRGFVGGELNGGVVGVGTAPTEVFSTGEAGSLISIRER